MYLLYIINVRSFRINNNLKNIIFNFKSLIRIYIINNNCTYIYIINNNVTYIYIINNNVYLHLHYKQQCYPHLPFIGSAVGFCIQKYNYTISRERCCKVADRLAHRAREKLISSNFLSSSVGNNMRFSTIYRLVTITESCLGDRNN